MNKAPTEKQVRKSVFGDLKKLASLLQNSDFDGYELNLHNPSEADLKAWYAFLDGENAKVVAAAEEAKQDGTDVLVNAASCELMKELILL